MTVRFEIENGKVNDTVSDANAYLIPMDKGSAEVYMEARYKTGFVQPLAIVDEGIIAEKWETREMFLGDEEEKNVLNKFFPLLKALSFIQGKGRIYGNLAPTHVLEIDEGYILGDLGKGAESDEINDYTALEFTFFQGEGLPSSDVYSVSVMMYEKLTGIHLDSAENRKEGDELVPLTAFGISDKTSDAIAKGLEIYAEDRYENIDELIDALYDDDKKEALTNDFSILIRPIKQREEEIKEEEIQEISEEEDKEEKKKPSAAEKAAMKKKAMMKFFIVVGGVIAVIVGAILLKAFVLDAKEEEVPEIKTIKTKAMPVEEDLEISFITPTPEVASGSAVSGSAVSGGAASGEPVELTPAPTNTPEPTPKPTKKPKPTKRPTPRPTKRPNPTRRPSPTKRPATPTPRVDGGDIVI